MPFLRRHCIVFQISIETFILSIPLSMTRSTPCCATCPPAPQTVMSVATCLTILRLDKWLSIIGLLLQVGWIYVCCKMPYNTQTGQMAIHHWITATGRLDICLLQHALQYSDLSDGCPSFCCISFCCLSFCCCLRWAGYIKLQHA